MKKAAEGRLFSVKSYDAAARQFRCGFAAVMIACGKLKNDALCASHHVSRSETHNCKL
jgi:hypothetical protein